MAAMRTSGGGNGGFSSSSSNMWRGRGRGRLPPQAQYRRVTRPSHTSQQQEDASGVGALDQDSTHSTDVALLGARSLAGKASPRSRAEAVGKEPEEKSRNAANFECNVCFDMAADPVVTKCGHLFCWECLYQWLHVHSNHRECPICKGEVADDSIIPIYGRGGSAASVTAAPPRPSGARVESSRQRQAYPAVPNLQLDDDDPFDFSYDYNRWFEPSPDALINMMEMMDDDVPMEDEYDHYEDVSDYEFLPAFPVFGQEFERLSMSSVTQPGAAGLLNPYSSPGARTEIVDTGAETAVAFFNNNNIRHPGSDYFGTNSRNRRRRHSRARISMSVDQVSANSSTMSADQVSANSSTDGMIQSSGGTFYSDRRACPNAAGPSRPHGGWSGRRGRISSSSNQASGRGMHHSRRQRASNNRIILD